MKNFCTKCLSCSRCDGQQCSARLYTIQSDGEIIAPGLCKAYINKDSDTLLDLSKFMFDLVVIFDAANQTLEQLRKIITVMKAYNRLVIVDITQDIDMRKEILELLKEHNITNFKYEYCIEQQPNNASVVDRAFKSIISPYFLVLEASTLVRNAHLLNQTISFKFSRFVFWSFLTRMGGTIMWFPHDYAGIYVSSAYKAMGGNYGSSFQEKLTATEQSGYRLWGVCAELFKENNDGIYSPTAQ